MFRAGSLVFRAKASYFVVEKVLVDKWVLLPLTPLPCS